MSTTESSTVVTSKRTLEYFEKFPVPSNPIQPSGPFHHIINRFLQEYGEPEDFNVKGMRVWCTHLVYQKWTVVPLYTIVNTIKHCSRRFCEHCRSAGWSDHCVSKRNYHLIIPNDEEWQKPLQDGILDQQNHLLHGLIHEEDGLGHLLCINGIEGGSKNIHGRDIMHLWDRICTNLQTRKVSVGDLSKKHLMDLRLLHVIAYGKTWFGRWGYRFFPGSVGVNTYNRAVKILSSLQLDEIVQDFHEWGYSGCRDIEQIIDCYRHLSLTYLDTIRDLFLFMLSLKSSSSQRPLSIRPVPRKFSDIAANMKRNLPSKLELMAQCIVDALKERRAGLSSKCVMTRTEAREVLLGDMSDTGLIDHVLKLLDNVIVGDYVVHRYVVRKDSTKYFTYSIQEVAQSKPVSALDIDNDVAYLYDNVLLRFPEVDMLASGVRTILDSKLFVKEWVVGTD